MHLLVLKFIIFFALQHFTVKYYICVKILLKVTFVDIRTQTKPEEFTEAVTNAVIRGWSRWKTELDTVETNDLNDENSSDTETDTEKDTEPDTELDLLDLPSNNLSLN